MESDKRNKVIVGIVLLVLLLALGVVGFMLFGAYNEYASEPDIKSSTVTEPTTAEAESEKYAMPENPINFKKLRKINTEIVAWIIVPDTKIDYPVLQSEVADDYYLHRDIYGNTKYAGSIYMEYCNSDEFSDRVTVLYGHNMVGGGMFANLHKFEDKSFFDSKKHRYFYVYTSDRKLTYEVVSAYAYDNRHIMNSFNFAENKVFKDYLKSIQNPRSAVRNVRKKLDHKLTTDDKILTLSTCLNSGDGRYLLQGVLVKDELTR